MGKGVPTALTAYTVISLLESETPITEDQLSNAFKCISRQTDPNLYTLALTAYAYTLAGRDTLAINILDQLFARANTEGTSTYWSTTSKSISVELGAYVILSLMKLGGSENQAKALGIVRWIARQRNSNGGFVSTQVGFVAISIWFEIFCNSNADPFASFQDTVIALQAFAKFAVVQSQNKQDLEVSVEANGFEHKYAVNATNRLLMQTDKIEELPNIIDVAAVGDGCGLIQVGVCSF